MSAVAITISGDGQQAILSSDGLTQQNGGVHSLSSSKILKVNDHIGMLWMGVGKKPCGYEVFKRAEQVNTVEEVAKIVGEELRIKYDTEGGRQILQTMPFWVLVVGYDDQGFSAWLVFSQAPDKFTPFKQDLRPGSIGAKTASRGPESTSFQRLLVKKYYPLFQPNLAYAVTQAFNEMVETYKAEGEPCGGELFMEILTPRKG